MLSNIQPAALAELINGKDVTGKFVRLLLVMVSLVGFNLRGEDETPEEDAALYEARKVLVNMPIASTKHNHASTSAELTTGVITTVGLRPGLSSRLIHQRQK